MSTERSISSYPSGSQAVQRPLTAAEKLALSRQALHEALYPPPKVKKPGVIGSLRKLWPVGRKARPVADDAAHAAALAAAPVSAPASAFIGARGQAAQAPKGRTTESVLNEYSVADGQAAGSAAHAGKQAASALQQAISGVFGRIGGLVGAVLKARWRRHPANFALQVGEPLLEAEIRRHPIPWLAGAAAAGAAFVLLNPLKWKQPRRLMGSVVGKEVRVLATSGLVFFATSVLGELLRRSGSEK